MCQVDPFRIHCLIFSILRFFINTLATTNTVRVYAHTYYICESPVWDEIAGENYK